MSHPPTTTTTTTTTPKLQPHPPASVPVDKKKVFVGQLPFSTTKGMLAAKLTEVGLFDDVEDVFIVRRGSHVQGQFVVAFIVFKTEEAARTLVSMNCAHWPDISPNQIPLSFAKLQKRKLPAPTTPAPTASSASTPAPTASSASTPAPTASSASTPSSSAPWSLDAADVLRRGEKLIKAIRTAQFTALKEEMEGRARTALQEEATALQEKR